MAGDYKLFSFMDMNTSDTEWEKEFGKSFKCLFCWWMFGGAFAIGFATVTKIIEILWK